MPDALGDGLRVRFAQQAVLAAHNLLPGRREGGQNGPAQSFCLQDRHGIIFRTAGLDIQVRRRHVGVRIFHRPQQVKMAADARFFDLFPQTFFQGAVSQNPPMQIGTALCQQLAACPDGPVDALLLRQTAAGHQMEPLLR